MKIVVKEKGGIKGKVRIFKTRAGTNEILNITKWTDNLVMLGTNTGKDLILDRLNADNTYSLNITHGDIGTGTNTPAVSDTTLQTPTVRVAKANGSIASNVLSIFFFFSDAVLANGTYREFGSFVDGSATISTGQLFNRVLFASAYVKATGEDTTVQVDFTLT
jgi:hypothetical protein